ncbi:MAG: zinc ribbon domain-containing protein [Candidatus Adiutrix sp.]|jgi:putative FmdB family regulatory protein|nr:zinc ribbon domain-containing protein [Candidatus Adiutrix sp.]
MPIYEYQCEKCGETTEVLQKFSDAPLSVCPGCGGHMDKLMSMNSFQLKGSGWYVTDYAGKKTDGAASSSSSATAGKDAAKPAAPAEAPKAAAETPKSA